MINWFDANESQAFGSALADFFMERIPSDTTGKKAASMSKKKEVLGKMFMQIIKFKSEHKMNMYKKAKLGNAFKWKLRDAGYDSEFVDELTKTLMLKL
jgi:hypothetical protein